MDTSALINYSMTTRRPSPTRQTRRHCQTLLTHDQEIFVGLAFTVIDRNASAI